MSLFETSRHKGALRWLFYPLQVKLPLQAFVTILIVGFAVFLYKVNAPQYEAPRVAPGTGEVLQRDDLRAPASPEGPRRANDALTKHEEVTQETAKQFAAEKKRQAYAEKSVASQGPAALSRQQGSPDRSEESERDYASKPPLSMPAPPREGSIGAGRITEAPAAVSGSLARMKSERFSISVRVKDVADAAKKIEKLLEEEGAHQVTRESREGRESISAELKGEKVKGLLQKLSGVGDTRGSASETREGETVAIRIDLSRQ